MQLFGRKPDIYRTIEGFKMRALDSYRNSRMYFSEFASVKPKRLYLESKLLQLVSPKCYN